MNENKRSTDELIFGYLKGELTPDETKELTDWIKLDKTNKLYFDECSELWITTRASSNNHGYSVQEGFRKFRQKIETSKKLDTDSKRTSLFKEILRYAAIFIIAFSTGGYLFHYSGNKNINLKPAFSELIVPFGSRAKLLLPDGTEVTLNAGSTLKYDNLLGMNERVIQLEGEAYFKVAKDTGKPFIVKTPYLNVTALGTEFNVKAYEADNTIETTLVTGSVKVEPVTDNSKNEITILKPNQKLTYFKESSRIESGTAESKGKANNTLKPLKIHQSVDIQKSKKENVNIEPVVSWKENRWIFEQQSLEQMAVDLGRKFDVQILFNSERLKSYRFTGTILAEPIEQVLECLSISAPINFKLKGKIVTLSENKDFIEINKNLYTQPD